MVELKSPESTSSMMPMEEAFKSEELLSVWFSSLDLCGVADCDVCELSSKVLNTVIKYTKDPAFISEDYVLEFVLLVLGLGVLELAVEVVELEEEEVVLVGVQVLLGLQVDGHVVLDGQVEDVAQVEQVLVSDALCQKWLYLTCFEGVHTCS